MKVKDYSVHTLYTISHADKKLEYVDTHSALFCLLARPLPPQDTKSVLLARPEHTAVCIHRAPDSTNPYCPVYLIRWLSHLTYITAYRCAASQQREVLPRYVLGREMMHVLGQILHISNE